ncbi:MAG: nuclear transport factor 2 family protein [Gammaproteobacteria bacterium]|nr:nuclear transport factor 2 family protein [Gammaproteobacteria bacterium]
MQFTRGPALFAVLHLAVATAGTPVALDGVMATDAAFAALSVERGQQRAFEDNLARDGVIFRPTAVNGLEWLATHEPASGRLGWTPAGGAIGCDGRLAVTTGRWTYASPDGGDAASGHYLSVWRREPDGHWRLALDHGIDHAPGAAPSIVLSDALGALWPNAGEKACRASRWRASLDEEEQRLDEAIRARGLIEALRRAAAEGALAYRDDQPPGPLAASGAANDRSFGVGSEARAQFVAADPASNMGYSYGEIASPANGSTPAARAIYVRIWRNDGKHWLVALDMTTLIPPAGT